MHKILFAFLITFTAATATAADLAGRDVLVPVVARTPGALGTNWYTDLVVTNLTRTGPFPTRVFISFHTNDGQIGINRDLDINESLVLTDVVNNTFNLDQAVGYVRITSPNSLARISARARVFNRGSAG